MVVGLAVRHEYYGVKDEEGRLLLYVNSYIPSLLQMLPLETSLSFNSPFRCKYDNNKDLFCFVIVFSCWLSTEKGVIWAFAAPVLGIIAVRAYS